MGLFDTIFFDTPRTCSNCGAEIDQLQTKAFEPGLNEYHIGDVIFGSPFLNGVLREDLYCPCCNNTVQQVYLALWHTLLVGVFDDLELAERRVHTVDRAEVLDHLVRHQKSERTWHDRFSRLYGELQNYHDYHQRIAAGDIQGSEQMLQYFRIQEIVKADDPLGELIRANKPVNPEDETEVNREE